MTYYQQIKDGRAVVGRWVRLVYEYIIKGLENGLFYYDAKKAHGVIDFIEAHVHHTAGRLAPGLLKLELWQKALLSCIFGIVDANGVRVFREIVIVLGRKNGKSLLASAIIENCIYNDNEYGARAYCVAPKIDQADIVYEAFWQSVLLDNELSAITKSRKMDKYIQKTNSKVQKIPFNARTADGLDPHLTVADEIAAWTGDKGLKQYEVMRSAIGARTQPLVVSISTAGYVDGGIYDELIKRSTRFLLGDSKERRLLPFLYMIDDVTKWNDINELQKANPNLNVSVPVDFFLEEIAVAESSLSKKAEFLTKYCNIKQNSSLAWLPAHKVDAITGDAIDPDRFRDHYAVGGIDLSQTTDLTSACLCIEKNGVINVLSHFWMPEGRIDEAIARDGVPYNIYLQRGLLSLSGGNYVDYHDVFNWFREMVERFRIYPLKVGYDRFSAAYLVQDMTEYGFHMDDVYQGENLWPVLQEAEGMIKDGRIFIGDNDLLKMHLLNSAIKMNAERGRGKLVKIKPVARIDGTAALIDALTVRQKWFNEIGGQLANKREEDAADVAI